MRSLLLTIFLLIIPTLISGCFRNYEVLVDRDVIVQSAEPLYGTFYVPDPETQKMLKLPLEIPKGKLIIDREKLKEYRKDQ